MNPHHQKRGRIFNAVPNHPDWLACSDGHIYQQDGTVVPEHHKETGENRLRVNCVEHDGYHYVARLIAESFLGGLVQGSAVVHKNGDTADNRLTNLRLVREAGSHSSCATRRRLSRSQKRELHRQLASGVPKTQIATAVGTSPRNVRHHSTSCRCPF